MGGVKDWDKDGVDEMVKMMGEGMGWVGEEVERVEVEGGLEGLEVVLGGDFGVVLEGGGVGFVEGGGVGRNKGV